MVNVHPLLVHFPIALLSVYSLLEIVPVPHIRKTPYWFYVKAIFLILGFAAILPTILAGLIIQSQFAGQAKLVDLHSKFGELSAVIYGILAAVYLFSWMKTKAKLPINPIIIGTVAIAGLISILITGALGGTIVYGANLDIFTSFVYKLFFP